MRDVLLHGDALALLKTLESDSVDALCCDPPAGISFMGKDWDNPNMFPLREKGKGMKRKTGDGKVCDSQGFALGVEFDSSKRARDAFITFMTEVMAECLRVVKPGGHALIWALPRTSHWTATALEDAGWQIRDVISSVFGSGFPKSKNLGNGLGSALKPAHEHWILARKPLACANLASNVLAWGTGGLNIDASRVGYASAEDYEQALKGSQAMPDTNRDLKKAEGWQRPWMKEKPRQDASQYVKQSGRWPPNFLLSHSPECTPLACAEECAVRLLDEQAGERTARNGKTRNVDANSHFGNASPFEAERAIYRDGSQVSRFFPVFFPVQYHAKASRAERNAGCEALPIADDSTRNMIASKWIIDPRHPQGGYPQVESPALQNSHPTVKSLSLMRWLVRLITPPNGIVLDCFAGSGSTLVACVQEGFHFIGMEQDASYVAIAQARLAATHPEPVKRRAKIVKLPKRPTLAEQPTLWQEVV